MLHRTISVAFAASLIAACDASPERSAARPAGPVPMGPIRPQPAVGPVIGGITPESGSSKTIWTIRGEAMGSIDEVRFGAWQAEILSATDTEIVVTAAFPDRDSTVMLPVTIRNAQGTSDARPVYAFPGGTVREGGAETRTWNRTSAAAATDATIWVVDAARGLYAFDRATDTVVLVAANGANGLASLTSVFVSPSGEVYVTDQGTAGSRLLKMGGSSWLPIATLASPMVDLAFGADGSLYLAHADSLRKLAANGGDEASFAPAIPDEVGGAFVQGGTLFVTQKWSDTLLAIDTVSGAVVDLQPIGLNGPDAIRGDGSILYVVDNYGVRHIGAAGAVQTWAYRTLPFPGYGVVNRVSVLAGGSVLLSEPNGTSVVELSSPTAVRIAAAGIGSADGLANVGGAILISSQESCFDESGIGASLKLGVVYALTAGSARIVSRDVCPSYGLSADGDGAVLFTSVSDDLTRAVAARLSIADGSVEVLADEVDGLVYPTNAVRDEEGNVYVSDADFYQWPVVGTIARIDTNGLVTPAWAQSPNPDGYTWALAVSGSDLWMTDLGAMGVWRVPLATGGLTESVTSAAALLPSIDGIAADGQGGIVLTDSLALGLHRIDDQGTLSSASNTSDFGAPRGVDVDRTTGDVQVLDLEADGTAVHAVMP